MAALDSSATPAGHPAVHLLRHHRPPDRTHRQEPHHRDLAPRPPATASSAPGWCCTGGPSCPAGTTTPPPWPTSWTPAATPTRSCSPATTTSRERRLPALPWRRAALRRRDYHRRKAMPAELDAAVIAAWRASGITTPAVPQDLLRRRLRPRRSRLQRPLGRPGTLRHLPRRPAAALRRRPPPAHPGDHAPASSTSSATTTPYLIERRPRLDPRAQRAAPLRRSSTPRLPDLGTRPAPLSAQPTAAPRTATAPDPGPGSAGFAALTRPAHRRGRGIQTTNTTDPDGASAMITTQHRRLDNAPARRPRPGRQRRPGPRQRSHPRNRRRPHHRRAARHRPPPTPP